MQRSLLILVFLCLLIANLHCTWASDRPAPWSRPVAPFQIADHTWYIGTEGLASIMIKTKAGVIMIDGGLPGATKMLLQNMRKIGVNPKDLKWIVFTHAHQDHVGPLAGIKRTTGAKIASNAESATLALRGGKGDIHFGDEVPYPPFKADRLLMDGETIHLGGIALTVHFTPAHTPGSMSWTWTDRKNGKDIRIVYSDSLSAPGYKLVANPRYPHILEDFQKGINKIRSLPCDLLITPHPEASGWTPASQASPLAKPMSCKAFADSVEKRLEEQVKKEKGQQRD